MSKKELGQFYTTQKNKILIGLTIPDNINIIEPFCGKGDLIEGIKVECYDIDPKIQDCVKRDTLLNPPTYKEKFVITNPPYLARNKDKNNKIFKKFEENDLYKCFIRTLISDPPKGGILIIPFNFFCCLRKSDIQLRKEFLTLFRIKRLNIFEEDVFDDTSCSVCSFEFYYSPSEKQDINAYFYPSEEQINIHVSDDNYWMYGGEIFNLKSSNVKVSRLLKNQTPNTNIMLYAIDDGKMNGKSIRLEYDEKHYYGKDTDRNKATIVLSTNLTKEQQIDLIKRFNIFLENKRKEFHSLFLTNFRESKDYQRKRISFELVYSIISHLLI